MVDQTSKIESQYAITSDSSSINKAVKDTDKFRASVADTDKEVDVLDKSLLALDAQAQATGKQIADSMKEAREETSLLGVEAKEAARQMEIAAKRSRDIKPLPSEAGAGIGGIARGAASIQRAVPGLAGGPIGTGLDLARSAAELKTALPELGSSMKDTAKSAVSAVSSMGPAGIALGVAIAAVAVASKLAADSIAKDVKNLKRTLAAKEEVNELIVRGDEETILARKELALEEIAIQRRNIADQEAARDKAESGLNFAQFFDVLIETEEDVAKERLQISRDTLAAEEAILNELNEAFPEVKASAAETSAALRDSATAAGDRIRLEQELTQVTTEEAQNRLTAINNQSEALQAELAVLKESGDTTTATTDRIAELEAELGRLGEESNAVSDALASGAIAAKEAAEAQVEASEKIATARDKAADQVAQAEARYTQSISDIAQSTTQSINDAIAAVNERTADLADKLTSDLTKISIKGSESFTELLEDIAKAELKTKKDTAKELRKIDQQAEDSITDALDERNVLRLLDISKQRKRDRRDRKAETSEKELEFAEEARERKIKEREDLRETRQDRLAAFKEQEDDLDKNLDRQIDKINQSEDRRIAQAEKARRRALEVAQDGLDKELELFRKFFEELNRETGRGLRGAGRKKKRGRGISLAPRQFASSTITG